MTRERIDCRKCSSDTSCTVGLAAGSEDELMEAGVQSAISAHRHRDSPPGA